MGRTTDAKERETRVRVLPKGKGLCRCEGDAFAHRPRARRANARHEVTRVNVGEIERA
jgi:hypothetical protein